MPRKGWNIFFVIALLLLSVGCTQPIVQRETTSPPAVSLPPAGSGDRRVLAGEWEYEDGAVVTLTLDEQGNGTYPWKEGRFETTALSDHTWQGMWFQKENDREGGFTVKFSPDFSEGEGHWWYSRIEDDRAPTQKGGTFRLRRLTSQASASNILLAP
ncbi:MAG TPA: hypothetical protein VNI35_06800 [Nitrospira sp.]|nr:hypothetical protein [Nitrospira sp.]